jgi:pyruvate dehydrogenase E1 component beta subunit
MEHKTLWGARGPVNLEAVVPLGRAVVRRPGTHLTLVSWSRQALVCEEACLELDREGISCELIDLRTLWPWDRETVLESCGRSGALLVVHEAVQVAGFGAEIAATAAEVTGCRVKRLGAPRIPVGYAASLEAQARVGVPAIVQAARSLAGARQ